MCAFVMALTCCILGSGIGSDTNKLSRNISSEDVDINDFFLCAQFVTQSFLKQIWAWECDKEKLCKQADLWGWSLDDCEY